MHGNQLVKVKQLNNELGNLAGNTVSKLPQQLYSAEQVREHEPLAAQRANVSMWQLMQRAGEAGWQLLAKQLPQGSRIAVFCGVGNNGGDGYVLAVQAQLAGHEVRVYAAATPQTAEGRAACEQWLQQGGSIEALHEWHDFDPDWLVDGLLGTGLQRPVTGELAECIEAMNEATLPILALDIPSGLHANTGMVLGVAVKAKFTLTMVALKKGLVTGMAADYVGELHCNDLGIQREFRVLVEPQAWLLQQAQLAQLIPPRQHVCHKGSFGHVLIIGGSAGMAGAAFLAASAALRTGAGKVTVICEPGQELGWLQQPELMVRGLPAHAAAAEALLEAASVVAIGPGLGQGSWGKAWWQRFCARSQEKPIAAVIDADALNFLAAQLATGEELPLAEGAIYTPHPGEAARLLQCSTADIGNNRWLAAATLQELLNGTVVLKGAGSIISSADNCAVSTYGCPAMAAAGMGDVLTGIIAGLLAQQSALAIPAYSVVEAGVMLHGLAGEYAAFNEDTEQLRSRGIVASELIQALAKVLPQ